MSKISSKELFEWYAKVAEKNINEMPKFETFKDCKDEKIFKNYMLNVFIKYYGLRCTCDDAMDWDFGNASSHYHSCDLWRFCFIVNRCLDWSKNLRQRGEGMK